MYFLVLFYYSVKHYVTCLLQMVIIVIILIINVYLSLVATQNVIKIILPLRKPLNVTQCISRAW